MNKPVKYLLSFVLLSFLLNVCVVYGQSEEERRRGYLNDLIKVQEQPPSADAFVSHHDSTWIGWVERTGELPPDFEAMPSIPHLPDPLIIDEGGANIPVETLDQWKEKREWISEQTKRILSGTFPEPPEHIDSEVLEERTENGVTIRLIELRFGENDQAKLTLETFTPPGNGPFPVFMTQWNHRGWAQIAVRRGYMGVIYAGADEKDDTRKYLELYPEHDWSTLMTRAWGAHRTVDYLHTLESVDKSKIALTGHSRNGKQSLFAAAYDDRITAVLSSSSGTGGEIPYRYTDNRYSNESIDFLTSRRTHWLHPRLRFYTGMEHKMPIDQHSLMALIAPNSLLLSSSVREGDGDPWAIEQAYHSLSRVYSFLEAPEKLGIRLRDGQHGVSARDIEDYMDWLDIQFDRKSASWENKLFYDYSFEKWKALSGENINPDEFPEISPEEVLSGSNGKEINTMDEWDQKKKSIQEDIIWLLGEEPAGISASQVQSLSNNGDYMSGFMRRPDVTNGRKLEIAPYHTLGDYQHGTIYFPEDENGSAANGENDKLPVVIYLHNYANNGFNSQLNSFFENILSEGMAVFAMDMIGFGTRIEEGTHFYERYPNWSKMGKMVTDVRAAITALEELEFIDDDQIFISGHVLGGTIGLFTAALDDRVAGVAVASAFTPLRNAGGNVEGIQTYSHLHGLLPRLGFFTDDAEKIPVDFTEIISAVAPRPLFVISPEMDRHAELENVKQSIEQVGKVYELYNASGALQFETPFDINRFSSRQQSDMVNWLKTISR